MVHNNVKILRRRANYNSPHNNQPSNSGNEAQARLGLALARANLIPGDLTHVSVPLRRVLARLASQVGAR